MKDLYTRHKIKRTKPLLDEILGVLQNVVATYSRVFIIVDALDESQTVGNCRSKFLSAIFSLHDKYDLNIFATSRFIPEIEENFNGSMSLEIRAHNEDISRYLEIRVSESGSNILRNHGEEIKVKITEAVDGM